ncbi:MAG TPA: hypothetical protein VGP92_00415 [Acidimicrobiia bacterium]|nr:hypothetical protein [Acidimicrobiia bacterium]
MPGDDSDDSDEGDDLEAIDLLADETRDTAPAPRRLGSRRISQRTLVVTIAATVVALITGVAIGTQFGGSTRPASPPRAALTPFHSVRETTTPAAPPETTLRVLFTLVSPRGSVVVARAGAVPTSEAHICGLGVPVTPNDDRNCRSGRSAGVRFDFSAPGAPWYRLTVLDADFANGSNGVVLAPISLGSEIRLVHADGSSTPLNGFVPLQLAAFHSNGVARVRVHLARGGAQEMVPVDGWTAFAEVGTDTQQPFGIRVEGLDAHGRVVATAFPFRCC